MSKRLIFTRLLLMAVALGLWFATQHWLGARPLMTGSASIGDGVHTLTAPIHGWLVDHPGTADGLLIASSLCIDLLALALFGLSLFGKSMRPFIGVLIIFLLRQICQVTCALPPPPGMIWRDPGFPSLLVTYGVASDFFFSGHTAMAVWGCMELARLGRKWLWLAVAVAVFEIAVVLVLRAHWTMDVFTGLVVALWMGSWGGRPARWVDEKITSLTKGAD